MILCGAQPVHELVPMAAVFEVARGSTSAAFVFLNRVGALSLVPSARTKRKLSSASLQLTPRPMVRPKVRLALALALGGVVMRRTRGAPWKQPTDGSKKLVG